MKSCELGELDDLVEAPRDLALGQAEHDAVDEDVLAAGDLRVEAGAELDQRRDAPVDAIRARWSAADAGDALEHRALAGAVAADDAVGAALRHREATRPAAPRRSRPACRSRIRLPRQQRALQGRELLLVRVAPVDLRDVDERRWPASLTLPPRTSRAADRRRSSRPGTRTIDATASASSHRQCPYGPDVEQHLLIRDRQVRQRVQVQQPAARARRLRASDR